MPDIPYKYLQDENGETFYPITGSSSMVDPVPIAKGGTGAQTAEDAADNLGFDEGSNYIKFPNGTLICWGTESIPRAAGGNTVTKVFPVAFYSAPSVVVTYDTSRPDLWHGSAQGITTTSAMLTLYNSSTAQSTNGSIHYVAIGRWKA